MNHDDVLVLLYSGSYSSALALRSVLEASGIRSAFEDLPSSPHGQPDSRVYVALGDVERALPMVADFRANSRSRLDAWLASTSAAA